MATVEIKIEPLDEDSSVFNQEELTIKSEADYDSCSDLIEKTEPEVQNTQCGRPLNLDEDVSVQNSMESRDSMFEILNSIKEEGDVSEPDEPTNEAFYRESCMVFIPKEATTPAVQQTTKEENSDLRLANIKSLAEKDKNENLEIDCSATLPSSKIVSFPKIVTHDMDFEAFAQLMLSGFTTNSYVGSNKSDSLLKKNLQKLKAKERETNAIAGPVSGTTNGLYLKAGETPTYDVIVDSEGNTFKIKKENFLVDSLKIKEEPLDEDQLLTNKICDPDVQKRTDELETQIKEEDESDETEDTEEDNEPPQMPKPLPFIKTESTDDREESQESCDFNDIIEELFDRKVKSIARERNGKVDLQSNKNQNPVEHKQKRGRPKKNTFSINPKSLLKSSQDKRKRSALKRTKPELETELEAQPNEAETAKRTKLAPEIEQKTHSIKSETVETTNLTEAELDAELSKLETAKRKLLTLKNSTNFKHKWQKQKSPKKKKTTESDTPVLEEKRRLLVKKPQESLLKKKANENVPVKYTAAKKPRKGWKSIATNDFDEMVAMKLKSSTHDPNIKDENSVPVENILLVDDATCLQSGSHAANDFEKMLDNLQKLKENTKETEKAIDQEGISQIPSIPTAVDSSPLEKKNNLASTQTIINVNKVDDLDDMIRSVKVIQELKNEYTKVVEKTPDVEPEWSATNIQSNFSSTETTETKSVQYILPFSFYVPLRTDEKTLVLDKKYNYNWVCPYCQFQYRTALSLYDHLSKEHSYHTPFLHDREFELRPDVQDEETFCYLCRVTFIDTETLHKHLKQMHSDQTEEERIELRKRKAQNFLCNICGKKLANRSSLSDHISADCGRNPQHGCEVCGKKFHAKSTLKLHKTMHTGELPHSCSFCEKRFRTRGQLTVHTRTHTGEKPFPCKVCHQRFTHRETLISHLSRHIDMKRYKCYYCDMLFSCISALKAHRSIRPTTCGSIKLNARAIGPRVRVIKGTVLFEPQPEFNPRLVKKKQSFRVSEALRAVLHDHDYFPVEEKANKKKQNSEVIRSEPSPMG